MRINKDHSNEDKLLVDRGATTKGQLPPCNGGVPGSQVRWLVPKGGGGALLETVWEVVPSDWSQVGLEKQRAVSC